VALSRSVAIGGGSAYANRDHRNLHEPRSTQCMAWRYGQDVTVQLTGTAAAARLADWTARLGGAESGADGRDGAPVRAGGPRPAGGAQWRNMAARWDSDLVMTGVSRLRRAVVTTPQLSYSA
jgi:hypothetical protein